MERTIVDLGDTVVCDFCSADFTRGAASLETGGFLFGNYATCPRCADRIETGAAKSNESHFIIDRARPGETFKAACLRWRGGNNKVTIDSAKDDPFTKALVQDLLARKNGVR